MMIRQPTPRDKQLEWWKSVVSGQDSSSFDHPECGYYKKRLKPWSPIWITAQITLDQPINWETGELTEPETFRLELHYPSQTITITDQFEIWDRWLRLKPISLQEWNWIRARLPIQLLGTPSTA